MIKIFFILRRLFFILRTEFFFCILWSCILTDVCWDLELFFIWFIRDFSLFIRLWINFYSLVYILRKSVL